MGDAGLRFDYLRESQLGDVIIHPDLTDLSVFGSKMDPTLQGQPAVLPASDRTNSGTRALVEGTTEGLQRLLDLPLETLRRMIDRFQASLTPREIGTGEPEFGNRPESVRQLAGPLYALGLPVHCLPVCGAWQYARLGPSPDLGAAVSYH